MLGRIVPEHFSRGAYLLDTSTIMWKNSALATYVTYDENFYDHHKTPRGAGHTVGRFYRTPHVGRHHFL